MYIPIFEIKDSFIVRHKLNYNTSYNMGSGVGDGFISHKQRLIFTDYDLARKVLSENAENFKPIIISSDLRSFSFITFSYLNEKFNIKLDGDVEYENKWIKNNTVFNHVKPNEYIGNKKNQEFKTTNLIYNIFRSETVTIEIYQKTIETGEVEWEYNSVYVGEKWFISGIAPCGKQWIIENISTVIGYQTGTSVWEVENIKPLLTYDSNVLDIDSNSLFLKNKIETYLFNNFSNMDNVYFKIISNNHSARDINSILNKLKSYKYFEYFNYQITDKYLKITPKKTKENIYFYYDRMSIKLYNIQETIYVDNGFVDENFVQNHAPEELEINIGYVSNDPDEYVLQGYVDGFDIQTFYFKTDNIYNKYTLDILLKQFINDTDKYHIYKSDIVMEVDVDRSNFIYFNDNKNFIDLYVNDTSMLKEYTFIKCVILNRNDYDPSSVVDYDPNSWIDPNLYPTYNLLILSIKGNIVRLQKNKNFTPNQIIVNITNLTTIKDISYVLDRTFENYTDNNYNKHELKTRRKIYEAYGKIIGKIPIDDIIKSETSGILYEDDKNIMVFKIFDPTDFKDKRLTYVPVELVRIGSDKKISMPVIIENFEVTIVGDVIDSNITNRNGENPPYLFDSNVPDIELIIDANI